MVISCQKYNRTVNNGQLPKRLFGEILVPLPCPLIIRRQADARRGARTGDIPTPILKSSGGSPVVVHGVTGGD